MSPRPVWHVCPHDDSSHLAGPWCERATTSTGAAVPEQLLVQPRPAATASSHRTLRTDVVYVTYADVDLTPDRASLPVFTPLGVSSRFRC